MRKSDIPGIRALILRLGIAPYIVDGKWDGFTVVDDGSGRFLAWHRDWCGLESLSALPDGSVPRSALVGSMERQMRRLAAEGLWGKVKRSKQRIWARSPLRPRARPGSK
jgi:hypothetical protein